MIKMRFSNVLWLPNKVTQLVDTSRHWTRPSNGGSRAFATVSNDKALKPSHKQHLRCKIKNADNSPSVRKTDYEKQWIIQTSFCQPALWTEILISVPTSAWWKLPSPFLPRGRTVHSSCGVPGAESLMPNLQTREAVLVVFYFVNTF